MAKPIQGCEPITELIDIAQTVLTQRGKVNMITATAEWHKRYPKLRQPSDAKWREAFSLIGLAETKS